jgi:hypothetical protein
MIGAKMMALAGAIVGVMMFAGVRGGVPPRPEQAAPHATSELAKRLKPVLNDTTPIDRVSSEFQTAEDFAATLHAARNIHVPFLELKRLVVDEGMTLAEAIHEVKPVANASLEADLARSEARADLGAMK